MLNELTRTRIRERLLARQRELSTQADRLKADLRRDLEPLSTDAPDRAIQRENDDVVDSLSEAAQAESQAVAAALHRLDEGHYGVCETCGEQIDAKRLTVVPYTDQCQRCAAQAGS